MNICPVCKQKYADSLRFCLEDGAALSPFDDPQATLRIPARQTHPGAPAERRLAFGVLALAGIVLGGMVCVVAFVVLYYNWSNRTSSDPNQTNNPSIITANTGQGSSRAGSSRPDVEQELEHVNAEVGFSLVQSDLNALDRLLADDYRYVSDAGVSLTKQEVLTLFRTGNLHYEYLTTSDPKVEVNSDLNKGVVSGRAKSKGQFRRQLFTDSYFYRNTYEKRQDRWQLVSGLAWHH